MPLRGLYSQPTQPSKPDCVDQLEEIAVVHLAVVGLAAVGRARDLVVAGERAELLIAIGDVALHDLAVIEVELQADVGSADLVDDRARLAGGIEEIAGDVAAC